MGLEHAIYFRTVDSPVGPLMLAGNQVALRRLAFVREGLPAPDEDWTIDRLGVLDGPCRELERYFAGRLTRFETAIAP